MNGGQLTSLFAVTPSPSELAAKVTGGATAGGGVVLIATHDLAAGFSATAVAGGLMIVSGAALAAYGNWRARRREEQAKDDEARRASEEEEARHRMRLEEIASGSLTAQLDAIRAQLDHAGERLEDANAKLHRAASDRDGLQKMLQLQQTDFASERGKLIGQLRALQKQLGLPVDPDPDLGTDEMPTLPKVVKQAVKDALSESHDEIPTSGRVQQDPRDQPK